MAGDTRRDGVASPAKGREATSTVTGAGLRTVDDIAALVADFETCLLPRSSWDHAAHLTVAAWYLSTLPEEDATGRMIGGIRRYNRAHGIEATVGGGYHETITLFWLAAVRVALDRAGARADDLAGRVAAVCARYVGREGLIFEFYDREVLFSLRARTCWVPPTSLVGGDWVDLSRALGAGR